MIGGNRSTSGGSPQGSLDSAQGSLWLRWLRPTTAFGAHRAPLRPGPLLENVFWADAQPPIKMGASFMFARGEKKLPNPVDKHVGRRVRMRRLMLAMSQEKLGDALGLTFQQVQKYEKGTNRIGASRLQQISHILQVPVAFFFEGAPNLHGSTDRMKEAPLLPTCRISSPPPKGSC